MDEFDFEVINKNKIQEQLNEELKANKLIDNDLKNKDFETTIIKSKDAEKQEAEKAKDLYYLRVAETRDVVSLGKKKTLSFKPKSVREKREEYNRKIDEAKALTIRATANTLFVQKTVLDAIKRSEDEIKVTEENANVQQELLISNLQELDKNSFSTAYIKLNFSFLYRTVMRFKKLDSLRGGDCEANFAELKKKISPLIEAIEYRLKTYAERNRIKLDGSVLDEKEEGATLLEADVIEWKKMITAYKARMQTESDMETESDMQIESGMDEYDRLLIRKRKEELGMSQAKMLDYKNGKVAILTREQAMMTQSDILSKKKRDQLKDLNTKLSIYIETKHLTDLEKIPKAINEYIIGTRYSVGYTEERKRLKKAIKVVKEGIDNIEDQPNLTSQLQDIKKYFDEMTNGTLKVDNEVKEDVKVHEDYMLEEVGNVKGKKRTKLYNGVKYMSNQENTPLFSHEPVVNDLKQRMVSNCFMMAATAGIINISPDLIKSCLRDNGDGTVTVRLYNKDTIDDKPVFTPRYYTMRKTIPRVGVGAASMDLLSAGCLWMQMIEKAFAFHGRRIGDQDTKGYRSLWYGRGDMFIETLLGVPTSDTVNLATDLGQDVFWEEICNLQNNKLVFSTGTLDDSMKGLDTEHAYTILGGEVINNKKYVKMRNPYSNHSLQYKSNNKTTHSGGPTAFSNSSDDTYGQFYMTFDDFLRNFPNVFRSDLYDKVKTNTNEQLDDEKRGLSPKLKAKLEKRERDIKEAEEKRKKENPGNQEGQDNGIGDNDEDDF